MKNWKFLICSILISGLVATGCQPANSRMEPVIGYIPSPGRISDLPSAFQPLSEMEGEQEWGKELLIGDVFAREWDFYRAITCYKRALVLIPEEEVERRLQIDYNIILCYYLGLKYQEAVNVFESSNLLHVNSLFPAFNNLLVILYECYQQIGQYDKGCDLLETINKYSAETADDLSLFWPLKKGDIPQAQEAICSHRNFETLQNDLDLYYQFAKSPRKARTLNAILPGAGYYYVGQKNTALTSFLINTLFTFASYQFFNRGYPAAGAIMASMEMGWYLGGINGAGIEAEEFNNRLYEGAVRKTLVDHQLFPVLMFETSF
ncbi:MAG: tetratricopeptide repeat protein [Candidatus Protochlamydia sp.]|nr:tetratricopeptide repeat protein [Candidatus Protochlamydia sp.]